MLQGISHFLRRKLSPKATQWPFIRGDYIVVDALAPVVVATFGDKALANEVAAVRPAGLCMVATLRTATDGAELLETIATNLSIQSLISIGDDADKRPLGAALLRLGREEDVPAGPVGASMNAISAEFDTAALTEIRRRVEFVDLLTCSDLKKIVARIETARVGAHRPDTGIVTREESSGLPHLIVPRDMRYEVRPDKAGRFVIRLDEHSIVVEHFDAKHEPLRTIEGKTARDLCVALIRNGWVSKLDHAAYLGRELARAEAALRNGQPFRQDAVEPVDAGPAPATKE